MAERNWVLIGCGSIANEMAQAFDMLGRKAYGVAGRSADKTRAFAAKYGIGKVYERIGDVFTDPAVDVVYIATPHNTHIPYLRGALAAGKHVLCEKAITLNSDELSEACALAETNQLILSEAMTLYHMPLYRTLSDRIASGAFGALQLIQVNFGSYKDYDMQNRFFNPLLAGGALLDIGVYALSLCRWFLSETANQICSQVRLAPSGVDEQSGILLSNPAGELATVTLSLHAKQPKRATIVFDRAYLEIFEYPRAAEATIVWRETGERETVRAGRSAEAITYEIRDMEEAIRCPERAGELLHLGYTRDVMEIMTKLRRDWGMRYPEER